MRTEDIFKSVLLVLIPESLSDFVLTEVKEYKDRIGFRMGGISF
jgi:hypothetical protein